MILMIWTHRFVGMGFSFIFSTILALPLLEGLIILMVAFFVSSLPDWLDFKVLKLVGHRNRFTHGLPSLAIPGALSFFLLFVLKFSLLAWGLFVGVWTSWVMHLLLDALTYSGLPVGNRSYSFRWTRYDDPGKNLLLSLGGCALILIGLLLSFES